MDIKFSGYKMSSKQQAIICEACDLVLSQLVSKRLKDSLFLNIHVVKDLHVSHGIWGDVDVEDCYEKSPKEYTIRVNYSGIKSFIKMLEVLSHELVHVAQYATRRMRILSESFKVAYGKEHFNSHRMPYSERPWEIEAHEKEYILFSKAVNSSDNIQKYIEKSSYHYGLGM